VTGIDRYIAARSLDEALEVLAAGEATILAGGTDLMPQSRSGKLRFAATLMNIRRVPELAGIELAGDTIRLGALTTITELMNDPVVRTHLPVLVEVGDHFASDQIRNAATLGGNIGNASPAGDTLVPLMILDAQVELASKPNGVISRRLVPLQEFFVGPGRTRRDPKELVAAVCVPRPAEGFIGRFLKFGTRPALDISVISIGVGGVLRDRTLNRVRVAFGAVAPTPVRCPCSEQVLEGRPLSAELIGEAARAARDEVRPISDVRASAWYRKEMIHNMMERILSDVAAA
jgi:CO/xanthine dehydrogenase FAD-binding subunit